jgi:hypothetical protein
VSAVNLSHDVRTNWRGDVDAGGADKERVKRAAQKLLELEAAGASLSEILQGEAGITFIRDYCGGDAKVAGAAFALLHSPTGRAPADTAQGSHPPEGLEFKQNI